jgi:DNA-binding NarL/FixJ family response regulator
MRQALVVDDHPVVRDSIKDLLEKSFPALQVKTSSGDDGVLEQVCGTPWAFIVLDLKLPTHNGLEIIKEAKRRQRDSPIIVFSLYSQAQYAGRALRAGAVAYVSKDQPPLEIVKLANDILDGKKIQSPVVTRPILSDREMEILTGLGRGMKRTELPLSSASMKKR